MSVSKMSVSEASIIVFIKVLDDNGNLLSDTDWGELNQLAQELPKNNSAICNQLEDWLKESTSRQEMFQIYKQQLEAVTDKEVIDLKKTLGIGGSKSPTPANQQSKAARDIIVNSIIRHSPPSTPQTNPPKNK